MNKKHPLKMIKAQKKKKSIQNLNKKYNNI